MSKKATPKNQKAEVELNEDDLEQISGGFNPQPAPPLEGVFKFNQQLQRGPVGTTQQPVVPKIKK